MDGTVLEGQVTEYQSGRFVRIALQAGGNRTIPEQLIERIAFADGRLIDLRNVDEVKAVGTDEVHVRGGEKIKGTIVADVPDSHIIIVDADGRTRTIPRSAILRVYLDSGERLFRAYVDMVVLTQGTMLRGIVVDRVDGSHILLETELKDTLRIPYSKIVRIIQEFADGPESQPDSLITAPIRTHRVYCSAGLSVPTDAFGALDGSQAGFALPGFSASIQYISETRGGVLVAGGVSLRTFPVDVGSIREVIGAPNEIEISAESYKTYHVMVGVGLGRLEPGYAFAMGFLGVMRSSPMQYAISGFGSRIDVTGDFKTSFSYGAQFGFVFMHSISVSGFFARATPRHSVTASGTGEFETQQIVQPTSSLALNVGVVL